MQLGRMVKATCDNPNCDFVKLYFNTTLAQVRFIRSVLSKIPVLLEGDCPHTYVKLTEVDDY